MSPTPADPPKGGVQWRPLLVVFLTVVLDLVGFGIVIPLMTFYAEGFDASPQQVTWLMACYSIAQFFAAPLWGQVSDRYGRRPVMVVSIGLTALMLAGFASATSLWMLFLFRTLHGVMTANISTAQACVADVTTPESRAKGMGMIGAAFGIGFTLGPVIGAVLAPPEFKAAAGMAVETTAATLFGLPWTLATPLWFAAGLSALNFLLALVIFPETRRPDSVTEHRSISPTALLAALRNPLVGLCVLLVFVQVAAFALMESTFTLLAEHRYGFGARDVGKLFGAVGLVGIVVQGGLIGRLVRRFGERPLVPIGLALIAVGVLAMPFFPEGPARMPLMYLDFSIVAVGQGFASPALQGLISRAAAASEQGRILGSAQSMSALARAIGPAVGGLLYASISPAAPFVVAAVLLLLGVGLAFPATARAAAA